MFNELNKRLSKLVEKRFLDELFDYIERERLGTIKAYNFTQLFERSIGADGINLGSYTKKSEEINPLKEAGTPFTMVDTGLFKRSIYVEREGHTIHIGSTDPKLSEMESLSTFETTEFFGLTEDNTKHFINRWVKPYIKHMMTLKN